LQLAIRRDTIPSPHGGLRAVVDADLAEQTFDVNLYGRVGDVELARDMLVGSALHQLLQDHLFPVRQPAQIRLRRATRGQRPPAG